MSEYHSALCAITAYGGSVCTCGEDPLDEVQETHRGNLVWIGRSEQSSSRARMWVETHRTNPTD